MAALNVFLSANFSGLGRFFYLEELLAGTCVRSKREGGGLAMSAIEKKHPRFEKIEGGKSKGRSSRNGDEGHKLHLVFDRESYAKLVAIKGRLRAASFNEVIRRALDAYDIFDPHDATNPQANEPVGDVTETVLNGVPSADPSSVEHVYFQAPAWMIEYLNHEKKERGQTYAETVRQALRVLNQLVREREKLLDTVKGDKGSAEGNDKPSASGAFSGDAVHIMLALV